MRFSFLVPVLASLLLLSACNRNEPPKTPQDDKQAGKENQPIPPATPGTGSEPNVAQKKDPSKDRNDREQKLRAALKLCGSSHFSRSSPEPEVAIKLKGILDGIEGDLSDKVPRAAKFVSEKWPMAEYFIIEILPPKDLSLKKLQSLLGKEDRQGDGRLGPENRIPVTWYNYDWCGFAVTKQGDVIGLWADLKKLRSKDK